MREEEEAEMSLEVVLTGKRRPREEVDAGRVHAKSDYIDCRVSDV